MALVDGVNQKHDVLDLRSPERIARLKQREEMTRRRVVRPASSLDAVVRASTPPAATPEPVAPVRKQRRLFPLIAALVLAPVAMIGTTMALTNHSANKPAPAQTPAVAQAAPEPAPAPEPVAKPPVDSSQLQALITQFSASQGAPMSVWVKQLGEDGQQAATKAEQVYISASLYKLFVALDTYKQIDAGKWKLTDSAGGGTGRTIQGCLEIMINVSDNACGRALGEKLGWGKRNAELKALGFSGTNLASPQKTTSADVGKLLEGLQAGSLLSPTSTDQFMKFLKAQKVNNRLPMGLPAGTTIAHKTGDLDGYVHDAGIVFAPKATYIVVVMTGPWKTPASAAPQFATLSKQLYAYFNR